MDDELAPYMNCRRYLNAGLDDLCKVARRRRISESAILDACTKATSRVHLVAMLNGTGMALTDVGNVMGLTRERARQLANEVEEYETRQAETVFEPVDLERLRSFALDSLCTDANLYSERGNIKFTIIVDRFWILNPRCRKKDIQDALQALNLTLCQVAMQRMRIVDPQPWLAERYNAGMNSKEILAIVNKNMPVHKISEMAWSHFIRSFGFRPTGRPIL